MRSADTPIERLETRAYRIPTDQPEGDGTATWDSTTLVTVHLSAGGACGFGYTFASAASVELIRELLVNQVEGADALAVEAIGKAMAAKVRNVGRPGIASTAISAIDIALWDLKAKLLELPLVRLLGEVRESVEVYGSGGFTTYATSQVIKQVVGWADQGIARVKMKVGAQPSEDVARAATVSKALAGRAALMVDANGAYGHAEAIGKAHAFGEAGVSWFEEPVSADDLPGLRYVREHAPPGMQIAAGEYGYDATYFRRMLETGAVDVLQADATRCLGITGFMAAAHPCQTFGVPMSAHTVPSVHAHPACAATPLVHIEYFHDHVRIERMLLDGFIEPVQGRLRPDRSRPGIGVELKAADAAPYAIG